MSARSIPLVAGFAALLTLAAGPALAEPAHGAPSRTSCFLDEQWSDWRSPSPDVIYLKVDANRVYRLDLSSGSNQLQEPDVHLVSRVEGSDWICSPVDFQLEVADVSGTFREPLIVKAITQLTPAQVSAIPPQYRP